MGHHELPAHSTVFAGELLFDPLSFRKLAILPVLAGAVLAPTAERCHQESCAGSVSFPAHPTCAVRPGGFGCGGRRSRMKTKSEYQLPELDRARQRAPRDALHGRPAVRGGPRPAKRSSGRLWPAGRPSVRHPRPRLPGAPTAHHRQRQAARGSTTAGEREDSTRVGESSLAERIAEGHLHVESSKRCLNTGSY